MNKSTHLKGENIPGGSWMGLAYYRLAKIDHCGCIRAKSMHG